MENIPAWLETLRNVNPSLAERAQVDVERWQKLEQSESKLNLQNVSGSSYNLIKQLLENDYSYIGRLLRNDKDEQTEHELGLSAGINRKALKWLENYR